MEIPKLDEALIRLETAVSSGRRSPGYCHRLWSQFIRARDLYSCVVCDSPKQVAAHHILRKSFLIAAKYEIGNGITLCQPCHAEMHMAYNGKPDLGKPMDAEGGENIERMIDLLGYLASDASDRGILCDKYYHLSDQYLNTCKRFQGIEEELTFPGIRLEQAYWIWRQTPRAALKAILEANGLKMPSNFIQRGPII
ncbi:MAG: HNH endonuclease signature motif containing protein [Pseudohongiella sp.]|uniref:HNH endonuclease n=1 Tax=Pseudohongiella sp. TaxID=1979412 RepID=UPI0034A09E82